MLKFCLGTLVEGTPPGIVTYGLNLHFEEWKKNGVEEFSM